MKLREAGGCVARARDVQVFCLVTDTVGTWISITGPQARLLIDAAAQAGASEIEAEMIGDVLRIGVEHTLEDDEAAEGPHAVCSECGEPWEGELHECSEEDS